MAAANAYERITEKKVHNACMNYVLNDISVHHASYGKT